MKSQTLDMYVIHCTNRMRPLQESVVIALMDSMKRIGQLQPITVHISNEAETILVTGAHRLEAAKRLGWHAIQAVSIKGDEIERELHEIAENLHRAELTALERDKQVARWAELTTAKPKVSDSLSETPNKGGRPGHASAAARELGLDERNVRRAVQVASISAEGEQAARDAGLDDNRSALLSIAKEETPETQVAKAEEIAAAKKAAKTQSKKASQPSEPQIAQSPSASALAQQINERVEELGDFLFPWCQSMERWATDNLAAIKKDEASKDCLIQFLHLGADQLLLLAQTIDGRSNTHETQCEPASLENAAGVDELNEAGTDPQDGPSIGEASSPNKKRHVKTQQEIDLKERAARHGYKLKHSGTEYTLVRGEAGVGLPDLDEVECFIKEQLEERQEFQLFAPCGMPLSTMRWDDQQERYVRLPADALGAGPQQNACENGHE